MYLFIIRTISKSGFQLPKSFSFGIQQKLRNKEALDINEYSKLVRDVQPSILQYTIKPDTESLLFVVNKLLTQYPSLILDANNPQSTVVRDYFFLN